MTPNRTRLLALAALLAEPAEAHTTWRTGDPVPAWVQTQCCGPADAHRLEPDQVHEVEGGYRVDGYPDLIRRATALPSQDGAFWVFYRRYPDGSVSSVYCFFVPMSF